MPVMALWRIVPAARPDDPRWLTHAQWAEVVVRAPTAGQALVTADRMARVDAGGATPMGNESVTYRSAFLDEKLVTVRAVPEDELPDLPRAGPQEVLHAVKRRERTPP